MRFRVKMVSDLEYRDEMTGETTIVQEAFMVSKEYFTQTAAEKVMRRWNADIARVPVSLLQLRAIVVQE